ncbi:MAG TPA: isoprenylcysteine carboxylmethyltransferase family protein [Opitutaceae bacterium]|nr:isoprenylcysteine carboxylmethyltransferase family protein [Opitutaceae bacterium]
MNALRYYVALVFIVTLPPMILMWLLVHPFITFWRRLGLGWTCLLVGGVLGLVIGGLFLLRRTLLAVDFGTNWPLLAVGAVCLAVAVALRVRLHRHFSQQQLMGLPEMAPGRYPQRLVTEGLHAHVRHPRYLQALLVIVGVGLVANHLALYLAAALCVPGFWLIAVLEEKELRDRFGPAYEEYSRRVPRFIPRWRGKS